MTMLKRITALLLAAVLIFALVPMGAMASGTEEAAQETAQVLPAEIEATEEAMPLPEAAEPAAEEGQILSGLEVVKPDANVEVIPTQVNPLYADIYTAADFDLPAFPSDSGADTEPMASYYFVSQEDAVRQIRSNMKQRVQSITVYVKGPLDTSSRQTAYDMMDAAMAHTGNPKEGDYLLWQYGAWEAKITTSGSNYIYEYSMGYYTTAQQEAELDNAIMQLMWKLNVTYKSDYEKIKAVYDYLCENVTYDDTSPDSYMLKHTAYAALMNKTAVCQGYALLFYRLMLELGVDNRVIAGIGNGGPHGWNIVKLNGLYYNVDATWDAGMTDYNYFLVSTWNFLDHFRYLEYETIAFHQAYPMAAEDYVHGVKGEEDPYIWLGMCSDSILWVLYRDGTLELTGTGAIPDYPAVASQEFLAPWDYWEEEITEVVVGEGITRIGNYSFYNHNKLISVTLPSSIRTIGDSAFSSCENLASVNLPTGLTIIGSSAFDGSALTSVQLPNTLTTIEYHAFRGCDITEVTIPGSITNLCGFSECEKLSKVILSEGVVNIMELAFSECTALTEITIPGSVVQIGYLAFENCENLSIIRFCGDAPEVSYRTFPGVTATAYYPADNETWTDEVKQDYAGQITWIPFNSRVDLNTDLKVDDADVEYLLWYTLFPALYPLGANVDLNGDSEINDVDVEYLLWHTLFPDFYPIE